MKIFADKELQQEINEIYFGKVKAGEEKVLTVYLFNETKAIFANLAFEVMVREKTPKEIIEIPNPPLTIQPGTAEPLILKWRPTRNFKEALEVGLRITGEEVYTAKRLIPVEKEVTQS